MSRRKRRKPRRTGLAVIVLIALVGAGFLAWRISPRYRQLWPRAQPRPVRTPAAGGPSARPAERPSAIEVRLYFGRIVNGQERLVPITRRVPAAAPARAALEELIDGALPEGCQRPLPAGAAVRGLRIDGDVAVADFSRELLTDFHGGSDNEGVTIYAIVNTLASLPGVSRAQILVEGERVDTLGGHLDIRYPLSPNDELVVPAD